MTLALVLPLLSLQLVSAEIEVDVSSGRVEGTYRIITTADSVRFHAARQGGGELISYSMGVGAGAPVITGLGLFQVTLPASGPAVSSIRLAYVVERDARRVPIFAPDVPTDASSGAVTIRVTGVPESARVADGFPRMIRNVDGVVVASPANVPSFIIIPPDEGGVGINRLADGFVLLLIVTSSGLWIARRGWR